MQDTDPSRRPGAGPGGYAALKMHPFFKEIDWKNLRAQTPPKLALESVVYACLCAFLPLLFTKGMQLMMWQPCCHDSCHIGPHQQLSPCHPTTSSVAEPHSFKI